MTLNITIRETRPQTDCPVCREPLEATPQTCGACRARWHQDCADGCPSCGHQVSTLRRLVAAAAERILAELRGDTGASPDRLRQLAHDLGFPWGHRDNLRDDMDVDLDPERFDDYVVFRYPGSRYAVVVEAESFHDAFRRAEAEMVAEDFAVWWGGEDRPTDEDRHEALCRARHYALSRLEFKLDSEDSVDAIPIEGNVGAWAALARSSYAGDLRADEWIDAIYHAPDDHHAAALAGILAKHCASRLGRSAASAAVRWWRPGETRRVAKHLRQVFKAL